MAIVRSLAIGKARNSAGNLTFQEYDGRTIAREKPVRVANPRTPAQMAQRAKLTNLVNAWRNQFVALKKFFTVTGPHQSEFNAFTRLNMPYAEVPFVDDLGSIDKIPAGVYLASGNYPEHFLTVTTPDDIVNVAVANIALRELIEEGDIIAVIDPLNVSGNIVVTEFELNEANAELLRNGDPVATAITAPAVYNVVWYSPMRRMGTTARMGA